MPRFQLQPAKAQRSAKYIMNLHECYESLFAAVATCARHMSSSEVTIKTTALHDTHPSP
jgi:hypothetical protein